MAAFRTYRRRWLEAARSILGTALWVAAYARLLLHAPWTGLAATPVAVTGPIAYHYLLSPSRDRKRAASGSAETLRAC